MLLKESKYNYFSLLMPMDHIGFVGGNISRMLNDTRWRKIYCFYYSLILIYFIASDGPNLHSLMQSAQKSWLLLHFKRK